MIQEEVKPKQRSSFLRNSLHPDCNEGLTLVELLIVLALTVVVIGMVYSVIYFANQSFVRGGDQYQLRSGISVAADFITDEVRNATEIEIVAPPFGDPSSRYIYIDENVLKHYQTGTVENKSDKILTDESFFALRKDDTTGRCYVSINLKGTRRDEEFSLNTDVLLNNIKDLTGTAMGYAIRYKK